MSKSRRQNHRGKWATEAPVGYRRGGEGGIEIEKIDDSGGNRRQGGRSKRERKGRKINENRRQEGRDDAAIEEDNVVEAEIDCRGRNDDDEAEIDGKWEETMLPVQRERCHRCDFYPRLRKTTSLRHKYTVEGETTMMRHKLTIEGRRWRCPLKAEIYHEPGPFEFELEYMESKHCLEAAAYRATQARTEQFEKAKKCLTKVADRMKKYDDQADDMVTCGMRVTIDGHEGHASYSNDGM
ncbi:hypothetical protein ACLOJK_008605 [Asimina triloba]